eukprot:GHVN01098905.1.p1 GENE.GHVN01098905.1~~GHVN01098905.1.p1  ORF type:complete len:159 (+),score=7.50 GHVN01098905.1:79-555(+)
MDALCITPYGRHVCGLNDIRAAEFIEAYAKHLKVSGKFELPKWSEHVKTSVAKELAPYDSDWLYVRAASVLRHIYLRPKIGIGALRKVYGSKKRYGCAPGHFVKGGGKILRYCVQQFEKMGMVEAGAEGRRRLTRAARAELDSIARQLAVAEGIAVEE